MTTTQTIPKPTAPRAFGEPSAPAVRVPGLRRTYGRGPSPYEAVRGVDLDVPAGSITALVGTNGAGKTSTLEVLERLTPATAGEVSVLKRLRTGETRDAELLVSVALPGR